MTLDDDRAKYRHALVRFLDGAGEDALGDAYDIGLRAQRDGAGILEVTGMHQAVVSELLAEREDVGALLRAADSSLAELLSPFELSYRNVADANTALRRLNELLEEEAKRIAHALHDQAGTILATAALQLDLATSALPREVKTRLAEVRRLVDETGEQLRHLSHELRPTVLDDLGLLAALEFLAEGVEQRSDATVHVRGTLRERMAAPVETAVYRIVQEAVNNALLHSGSSPTIEVSVDRRQDKLVCHVVDDGAGFDTSAAEHVSQLRGLGVLGMRERATSVAGTFTIDSAPGRGTTIEVVVPLDTHARDSLER